MFGGIIDRTDIGMIERGSCLCLSMETSQSLRIPSYFFRQELESDETILTMRMQIRRLTRLTNALSKKWDNLKAAVALHFAYYNLCRVHSSLRVTAAMEAGLADHVWGLDELVGIGP